MTVKAPALVGVDWGTTRLRVMRLGEGGRILEHRVDPRGAGQLTPDAFAPVLESLAGDWMDSETPVLVCGMAGARMGWVEAPYVACPADVSTLASGTVEVPGKRAVRIIPGVCVSAGDLGDVMRGEETQAMGLVDPGEDGMIVAPGTHSKWITVRDGRIRDVRTFMTGELFSAVLKATVVGQGVGTAGKDDAAFDDGVRHALANPGLSALLFSVRVGRLSGRLGPDAAADYLSGLLIGAEIAAAPGNGVQAVRLVGDGTLVGRYSRALTLAGRPTAPVTDGDSATARGLWRIREAST